MKQKFTIIANCQTCIVDFLLSNPNFENIYQYIPLYTVHTTTQNDIDNIYNIIENIDLLLIQPINNNYKDLINFGTYNIISKTKPSCKIILFPSLHLNYYYPFCSYIFNNKTHKMLRSPIDYHDRNLINICKQYESLDIITDKFKEIVNNINLNDEEYCSSMFKNSINLLIKREEEYLSFIPEEKKNNTSIINSSSYIFENYKIKLLFYSMNHPTKYLFHYICDQIFNMLQIPLNKYPDTIDPLIHNNVPILYNFLSKNIDFDISTIPIIINGKQISIDEFVKIYYDVYSKLDLSEY